MYIIIQCQQQCLAMQQIIYLKRLMSDNIRLDMENRKRPAHARIAIKPVVS